jgi:hypothetical protein
MHLHVAIGSAAAYFGRPDVCVAVAQEPPPPEKPIEVTVSPPKPQEKQEQKPPKQTADDVQTFASQQSTTHEEDPDLLEVDRLLLGTKSQIEVGSCAVRPVSCCYG